MPIQFTAPGLVILFVVLVVLAFIVWAYKDAATAYKSDPQYAARYYKGTPRFKLAVRLIALVCVILLGEGVNCFVRACAIAPVTLPGTTSEAAESFGLMSGKAYPLVLGSRFGGTSVHAEAHGGFFRATASVTTQPASALSVSYTKDQSSYILEIPTSQITFRKSTSEQPSVTIYMTDSTYYAGASRERYGVKCHWVAINLFPSYTCTTVTTAPHLDADAKRRGLSPVVSQGRDSATIVLTPQMYEQVLGK